MSESKGQVENLLQELGRKIDDLVDEMKDVKDDLKEEFENKVDELREKKEQLEAEFDEFKNQEKWQEAKGHFVSAVGELRKAVQTALRKN